MPHINRISRIRSKLVDLEIEALLFFDMKNIRYLVGFSGSDGALLVGKNKAVLMVDGRYVTQAKGEIEEAEIFQYNDKIDGIAQVVTGSGLLGVGFESVAINFDHYLALNDRLDEVELRPISKEISSIRAVKEQNEIESIKKAVEISSQALISTLDLIRPGIRERDIALELEYRMRGEGAERISFETIVASGENAALPHATPGHRKLKNGDFVVIDYGAVHGGYHSDETCTFVVGSVTNRQKEIYNTVKDAHDRALDFVKAGVSCREVDRIARSHIEDAGLGRYFSHGTGHGVGLDVHEFPVLSTKAKGYLEKGMVVTIEPGVYIPDQWGVRIEDMILVEEDGCEVLTKMPKDLKILG
ncbi:MAG: Xaa-Pro peptidase family protein [Thermodesulfobacteriota bacterium]|nr:Xaa-Pro peptidase family protein [Thermodesulfobacteriota bacterium]